MIILMIKLLLMLPKLIIQRPKKTKTILFCVKRKTHDQKHKYYRTRNQKIIATSFRSKTWLCFI
ncbi:hypothetical protein [Spiroplasma poulsonii]|uniref:hypothetical protein n=1 Tax=Spiroplasma poulsonii TaxID=2138 RepID=UPI001F4C81D5|nr:hypothetical protein [Spiroplasma poulsonii]UNF62245.1 hypothetical protein MNU24_01945 [Spiroplasma poulsonii]